MLRSVYSKYLPTFRKTNNVIILGLVQPKVEVSTVVRNVGVHYQLTPHYTTEGFIVHSYR